ncbi:unnamed protein product, partial [Phaeothamnion confervicola]
GESIRRELEFECLVDLLHESDERAIAGIDDRAPISHARLKQFVRDFDLVRFGVGRATRVGLAIPNGPEFGVALLATIGCCCAAPVNVQGTAEEICAETHDFGCSVVILPSRGAMDGVREEIGALAYALRAAGVRVVFLRPSATEAGIFELFDSSFPSQPPQLLGSPPSPTQPPSPRERAGRQDVCLVLQTSGSTGRRKTVPYTLETLCVGAACVAAAWRLGPRDCGINMMPLIHIGGIARNLFAAVLSGGCAVLTTGFDPALFWELLVPTDATWFYGSPTIHQLILHALPDAAAAAAASTARIQIRVIASAGAALPPSTARALRRAFPNASVLPAYGMTECMPIATMPLPLPPSLAAPAAGAPENFRSTANDRPGSVGRACGPELSIRDGSGAELPPGAIGSICVRGAPLFPGYEVPEPDAEFLPDGFFVTGDLGVLDRDGFLFITGRSKEVINRGGEIVSPSEVEDVLLGHPAVAQVIAFSVSHDELQEVVGAAIVVATAHRQRRPSLADLQRHCASRLHPAKWPQAVVFFDGDLPRGATGKAQRVRLAERCVPGAQAMEAVIIARHFEATSPPAGLPLSVSLACVPCRADHGAVAAALAAL